MQDKLYYIANIRLPTEKAHGIQIMKTCEALANQGLDVELIVPKRKTPIQIDTFEYYQVKNNFKITKLWCLDTVRFGRIGYWIELLTFAERTTWYLLFKKGTFFTRDEFLAFYLRSIGKKVMWEAHMGQKNIFVRQIMLMKVPIVVISNGLKDLYKKMGLTERNIAVSPDGVDVGQFNINMSKNEARKNLGIGQEKKVVMYTGSRYSWKGVDTLEGARDLMPNIELMIVSGKPFREIPTYLRSADILVLPSSAKEDISKLYTSPMKLFEYMASGIPIVASDVESLREVLDESMAVFFTPDSPESLAKAVVHTLSDPQAIGRAARALKEVEKYTWDKRAQNIVEFINQNV